MAALGIFTLYLGVTLVYIPHYAWLAALQRVLPKLPFFASRVVTENFGTILGGRCAGAARAAARKICTDAFLCGGGDADAARSCSDLVPIMLYNDPGSTPGPSDGHSFQPRARKARRKPTLSRWSAAMSFFNQFAATTLLAVSLYYTDYVLGNKELGVTLAVVFLLSATLFVPLWSLLARSTIAASNSG
jgi:hypothetical protein